MALPVTQMCDMVVGKPRGENGSRIVDHIPELSEMQKLGSVSIPVVDVYMNRKLEDFPSDHIALAGSKYGLTVLDISQLWNEGEFDGNTAVILAASEGSAIPSVELERLGELMLQEFAEFFPEFNPGEKWGDKNSDVDWDKSWIRSNRQYKLFLNDTGSWGHRPKTLYEDKLPRVVFAGDCVRTDVDMATVEGAIQGGTQAAAAIQAQDAVLNGHARRGHPIELQPHTVYSTTTLRGARLLFLPVTYAAYGVAAYEQWKKRMEEGDHHLGENEFTMAEYAALIPMQFAIDWCKASYWFGRSLVGRGDEDPFGGRITYLPTPENLSADASGVQTEEMVQPDDDNDRVIGLPEAMFLAAREVFDYASGKDGFNNGAKEGEEDRPRDRVDDIVDLASDVIEFGFNIGERLFSGLSGRRPHGHSSYNRRWRHKD
jgi:hypothetical protein